MEAKPRELLNYETAEKIQPFQEWLRRLKGREARARIRVRLDRVENGNLGVHKSVGDGVWELIFDFGPGYRVYFGQRDTEIILLTGGNKNTQAIDIQEAKEYWEDYNAQQENQ